MQTIKTDGAESVEDIERMTRKKATRSPWLEMLQRDMFAAIAFVDLGFATAEEMDALLVLAFEGL